MPTPTNKKSAEAFVAALAKQQNFEGIVEGVGYVKCQIDDVWAIPKAPTPSMPKGRAVSTQIYTVSIERLDSNKVDDVPYFKKRFPQLTNEGLGTAITTLKGGTKEVQIGRELYYELLPSQNVKVDIDFRTGIVKLRLPPSQTYKGKDYPHYIRSMNSVYSVDKDKRETFVSIDDIQNEVLGYKARFFLIGDQQMIGINPYDVKVDYWDMLQNFSEYRPYIIGNKFTISFSVDYSLIGYGSVSTDFTWLFDGKDSSIYPYMTNTYSVGLSTGGGLSSSVSAGFGSFAGQTSRLTKETLSGASVGEEVSGAYGAGGAIGITRSLLSNDSISARNDYWDSAYISATIGGDGSPVTGVSCKAFASWTTKALHISPQKLKQLISE